MRRIYSAIVRVDRWLRVRFTPTGRFLLSALVAIGLFALNPRATLAYQLAGLVFAVLFAATLWAPAFRPALTARRLLPKFATVGVPLDYTVEIGNQKKRQLLGLEAVDEAARVSSAQSMRQARGDAVRSGARSWLPRGVGYMQFVRAWRFLEGVRCEASGIERLAPQAITRVPMRLVPTRRGYLRLSRMRFTRTDPLGIFRAVARVTVDDQVLVFPRRYRVSWNVAGQSSRNAHQGSSRSRTSGSGADFARLREYRPRDPLRHIHWRAWARLGAPVVKEFHEETPSRNALVLDVCASDGVTAGTFEEAVCVAASFVTESNWCSGQLDLLVAGERNVRISSGNEGEGIVRMLEALACVHASRDDDFASLARDLVRRLSHFSTCVLVLLDLEPQRLQLVRELQRAQVSTLVLLVSTRTPEQVAVDAHTLPNPRRLQVIHPQQAARALATLPPAGAEHA